MGADETDTGGAWREIMKIQRMLVRAGNLNNNLGSDQTIKQWIVGALGDENSIGRS